MIKTTIISAFPGMGKTTYHKDNLITTLDSDSSEFSWVKNEDGTNSKHRNPDFPQNYIEHIKSNIGKYEYIFVSSHENVRQSLIDNCIFFFVVYPSIDRRDEFMERYYSRGSSSEFSTFIFENWDKFITELDKYNLHYVNVVVEKEFPTMSDVVAFIEKIKLNPEI